MRYMIIHKGNPYERLFESGDCWLYRDQAIRKSLIKTIQQLVSIAYNFSNPISNYMIVAGKENPDNNKIYFDKLIIDCSKYIWLGTSQIKWHHILKQVRKK